MADRVYLYDTTLRDGAQTQGVDFNVADKTAIAEALDALGIDYVEGGWPGANPTDDAFFAAPPRLKKAKFAAFGMTRRAGRSASNDPVLTALFGSSARVSTMVGKTWDFQVKVALGIELDENIAMIRDSMKMAAEKMDEALFDAEHFFDGYKENPDYALKAVKTAYEAGARWVVLCDTNGGTLPHELERIVGEVAKHIPGDHLGIHVHDDTGNAVANSLAAVRAGARQIQGTLNGLGERCGNANLISIIPSLMLKMGFETGVSMENLKRLTHVSHLLDERLNRKPNRSAPYVGESAFAHKGGLHVSAVAKDPKTYEHIDPALVGNERTIVMSDQAGRSNVVSQLKDAGIDVDPKHPKIPELLDLVKTREYEGYSYDGAEASFELLARRALDGVPEYYKLVSFRVLDERRWNARGQLITLSEATVKIDVPCSNGTERHMTVAEGNGPVNALDNAIRKSLLPFYPQLEDMTLVDYKVRILTSSEGTKAVTRVIIESGDSSGARWSTVGVSANVIDASYNALYDAIVYKLFRAGVKA
ncbi:MAG TPA: citramalate synthase [Alphaproteobacteria bacterium]|nr:citramalate synthase [Alphaproteobacteria bacterium]